MTARRVAQPGHPKRVRDLHVCSGCGFVQIDELSSDRYRGRESLDELPAGGLRVGRVDRPGREFQMGRMAVRILARGSLDVLVYGAGRSFDNQHIEKLKRVRRVAIGDIMKVRDDAEFVDANQPATRTFDVVVASEVVEHFRNPPSDFGRLFEFVADDGLLVCGTNINDGRGRLERHRYIFYPDHTAYYTPAALRLLAEEHGFHVDFRTVNGHGGRKRYVLFTRSSKVLADVACYFGRNPAAPSEKDLTAE